MIITGSESSAEDFSKFFPKLCIFTKLDKSMNERLESIIKQQQKYRKEKKIAPKDFSTLLLMDDCGYDKKFFANNPTVSKIFMNGRHYNMLNIISLQYCKSIPPELRLNADYIFIMREPCIKERKKLHDEFGGIVPSFSAFSKIMDRCTDNYRCLVIDKTTSSNNIEDNVFFYKAHYPMKTFKAGCKDLWDCHKKYYNSDNE